MFAFIKNRILLAKTGNFSFLTCYFQKTKRRRSSNYSFFVMSEDKPSKRGCSILYNVVLKVPK